MVIHSCVIVCRYRIFLILLRTFRVCQVVWALGGTKLQQNASRGRVLRVNCVSGVLPPFARQNGPSSRRATGAVWVERRLTLMETTLQLRQAFPRTANKPWMAQTPIPGTALSTAQCLQPYVIL